MSFFQNDSNVPVPFIKSEKFKITFKAWASHWPKSKSEIFFPFLKPFDKWLFLSNDFFALAMLIFYMHKIEYTSIRTYKIVLRVKKMNIAITINMRWTIYSYNQWVQRCYVLWLCIYSAFLVEKIWNQFKTLLLFFEVTHLFIFKD